MSVEDVAEYLGVSLRNLQRWIANPGENISADFVTKLTLLWKLPDWLSDLFYKRAFIYLNDLDDRCCLIKEICRAYWTDDITKVNKYLAEHGQPPLAS